MLAPERPVTPKSKDIKPATPGYYYSGMRRGSLWDYRHAELFCYKNIRLSAFFSIKAISLCNL